MIVFPLIRSVGLKAATASSRVETLPMFVRSRPSRHRRIMSAMAFSCEPMSIPCSIAGFWLSIQRQEREVVLADKLMGSEYARLKGRTLRRPVNPADRANFLSLAQRFGAFEAGWREATLMDGVRHERRDLSPPPVSGNPLRCEFGLAPRNVRDHATLTSLGARI
jgi:hypothetical protein